MSDVKVKMNFTAATLTAKVDKAWGKALPLLTEEIMNDAHQFVKVDKHTLEMSALTHSRPQEGKIIWQTPYARRQYWEIRTAHKDVNAKATWKWFHVAKSHLMAKWARQAQRLTEMNL